MLGVGSTAPIINPFFWRLGPSNGSELSRSLIDFYGFGLSGVAYGVRNVTIVREDAAWSIAMSNGIRFYLGYYLPQVAMMTPQINFTDDIVIAPTATLDSVTTSLTPLNAELDGLDVNAIMQIFSGPVGRRVTQAWHALDLPQFLAGINVESQSSTFFDETNGASYGEIELETAPPDIAQTNKSATFRAAYLAKYDEQPTYTAFASYDAIYVLKDAMERADSFAGADVQVALATTHYTGTAYEIKFTSEDNVWDHPLFGYPYGQVGYYNNGTRFVIVPGQEDLIVHDLYTTSTVGVRGQPFIQGYFAQWQYGGVKKTVWGKGPGLADDMGGLSGNMTWPIDHSDTGYVETTTTTTTDTTDTSGTTDTADTTTTGTETTTTTTTTTTVTEIPGFGISMAFFVLVCVVSVSFKRHRNKR